MKRKRRDREGFILLTTLLIIAMVCILTFGLASHSMNYALEARVAEQQLQEKWGIASCQRFANQHRSSLLNRDDWNSETSSWQTTPIKQSSTNIQLGNTSISIQIEDESSKLNLNRLYDAAGRQATTSVTRKLAAQSDLRISLRPLPERSRRGSLEDSFECWGQVFLPRNRPIEANTIKTATKNLTCWGSSLNYRTASQAVLTESLKPILGSVRTRELVSILQSPEADNWKSAISAEGASSDQIETLDQWLVGSSRSQSVWVTCISNNRRVDKLTVHEQVTSTVRRVHSFSW